MRTIHALKGVASLLAAGVGIDLTFRMTREEVNDRELSRLVLSDAYK